jgi:cell division protease FtsH
VLEHLEAWMDAHPHLCGAKLTATGDFLKLDRAYSWKDIVIDGPTRATIERHVVQFVARLPRYQAFGLPTKRGVLLVGPPGTGKTLLGKVLCSLLPTTFLWVSPGEVPNPLALRRLFDLARELQPTLLFLEDLDLYASRRGMGNDALLGELLNQLDGFPANTGVLTLATTNDLKAIEPALAERPSRFDQVIRMDPPKVPERQALLARFLRNLPHPAECLVETAAATDGLAGAHLQEIVHLAIQRALDGQGPGETAPPSVTADHLREAVRIVRQQQPGTAGFYA